MKEVKKIIAFILIGLLLLVGQVRAQDKPDERLRLIHADVLKSEKIGDVTVRKLIGAVHLQQGDAAMFCQQAAQFLEEGKVILEGKVKIDDGQKVLTADKVIYYEHSRIEEASGNVKIVDGLRTLTADKVTYYETEDRALAQKNVKIVDSENRIVLTSGQGEYRRGQKYAMVTMAPELIKKDSLETEELRITGTKMEVFENGERALVSDNVVITKGETVAHCGEAEYFRNEDKILLRKTPLVWSKNEKLEGNSVELFFEKMKLKLVHVLDNAMITSEIDTLKGGKRINRLTGKEITISVKDDQMEKVVVKDQATSFYHIIEDGEYKGVNKVIGDQITLFLSNGELERIQIESTPGTSTGTYYPPGLETSLEKGSLQKI